MSEILITFFASFLIWFMFGGLFVLWVVDGKIKKEQVIHALVAFLLAQLVTEAIKKIFPTLRPFEVNGLPTLTLTAKADGAFPSGHTASSFALATTIFLHDKKVGTGFLAAASIVGVARVLSNVHYPIDIIGGAIEGISIAFLIEKAHLKKFIS